MRFLLVNTNNAVRKIFNITAKKAAIQLDAVGSINEIPLKEDYNCIFIDDGVLNTGDISKFKTKMITTKFCIILAKDSPLVGGFDSYIRKPFLPTDIYEVMKKEKSNDISVASSYASVDEGASVNVNNVNANIDLNEFSDSEDEFLSGIKDSGQEINFDLGVAPVGEDLDAESAKSDFEVPATGGFVDNDFRDIDLDSSAESSAQTAESNEIADDFEINFTLDSAELSEGDSKNIADSSAEMLDIKAVKDVDLALDSKNSADTPLDSAPKSTPKPKSVDILEEAEAQINNIKALADKGGNFYNSSNDTHNIDFSAVMALQDELLKEEETKKKKKLIGGDISKKKEPTKPQKSADSAPLANDLDENNLDEGEADFLETLDALNANKSTDSAEVPSDDLNFDALDDLQGISDIKSDESPAPSIPKSANDILNNLDINNIDEVAESSALQDFDSTFAQSINAEIDSISPNFNAKDFSAEIPQDAQKYNMLGLPIDESGEIKDINDLSESELEKLDDEALLLLQERALQENSVSKKANKKLSEIPAEKSPKVLNKQQIDDINNILETTQGAGENAFTGDFGGSEFAIKNDEFDSITQEALGEALNEQNIGDFGSDDFTQDSQNLGDFGGDFVDSAINNFAQDVIPEESELPNFNSFEAQDEFAPQDFAQDVMPEEFELPDNFEAQTFVQSQQNLDEDFALPAQPQQAQEPQVALQQAPQNQQNLQNIQNTPAKQISINDNLDLAEIIKTFPIDKLRDLLSGVQITINITFPTKKQ